MSPLISIIIPIYNAEAHICQCIDSVLSQTYTNLELLLIDDGSLDSCGKICDKYAEKDDRIHVFHKENGGVSKARNLGLDYASGDYICFIDSDDWVDTDMLEKIIEWQQRKQNDLLFYGFKYEAYDNRSDNMDLLQQFSGVYEGIDSVVKACYLLEQNDFFGWTWNKLFRGDIISEHNIRFEENISIQEDHIFTLAYLKYVNCLTVCPYVPYHYRILSNSLTSKSYPYSLHKQKLLYIFKGRMDLIDRVKYVDNVSAYRQFTVCCFLLTLLHFFKILFSGIEKRLEELSFIRMLVRKYALEGRIFKMCILYVISFLPVFFLEMFFKLYSTMCKLFSNNQDRSF